MFLKYRASKHGLSSGFILSSDNGHIHFWSLYADRLSLGGFYASHHEQQNVIALTSDSLNNLLVVGDTLGYVYILNIENYLIQPVVSGSLKAPECLSSWKCHNSSIVSCQLAESIEETLLIACSTDKCVKLWTIDGNLIGSFGQRNSWSLDDPKTFAANVNLSVSDELKQRLKQFFMQSLNDVKVKEDKIQKQVEILPELVLNKTNTSTINNENEIRNENFQFGFDFIELKGKKKQKHQIKSATLNSNFDYLDSIKLLKQKDSMYKFQLPSEIRKFKIVSLIFFYLKFA
jgi:WD40 repeat protein